MSEPTATEIERAKRWASLQNPPVTVGNYIGPNHWSIVDYPSFLDFDHGEDTLFDSADAAWSALALALRPIFNSIGTVLFEEAAKVCEATKVSQGLEWARSQFADILRRLAAGETT